MAIPPTPTPYVPARPYPHNPGATAQTRMYSTQSRKAEQRGTNEAKQAKPDEDGKPNTTRGAENQNQTEGDKCRGGNPPTTLPTRARVVISAI